MTRHTVEFLLKNHGISIKEEFALGYSSFMRINNKIIKDLGEKTHEKWHMEIGETKRLSYHDGFDFEKYTDLIFKSDEFKEDGWSHIGLDEERLTEKEEEDEVAFKKWLQHSIDNIKVYFSSSLRLDSSFSSMEFDISGEKNSQMFFDLIKYLFENFKEDINHVSVAQTSGKTKLYCVYPDRRKISWIQLIKAELLAEDVPSAYAVWYMPNIGSVVISTQEVFDNDNKKHKDTAHAIEQELHRIGLLPLIGEHDLKFIGRDEWRKNKGLPV